MKLQRIAAIGLVVLVTVAGVAEAAPENPPTDPGASDEEHGMSNDARGGGPNENASASEGNDVNRSENASATDGDASAANARGPGENLPEQVPDHVAQIHDLIRQFLGGGLDGPLGEAISGVTASDDASENPADASA